MLITFLLINIPAIVFAIITYEVSGARLIAINTIHLLLQSHHRDHHLFCVVLLGARNRLESGADRTALLTSCNGLFHVPHGVSGARHRAVEELASRQALPARQVPGRLAYSPRLFHASQLDSLAHDVQVQVL